ncbi:MAG TPA: UPF0175 family protein [Parafilimonas sp.]|nr:UPF0175 family protein [Parafilimonas sp.]
MIIEIPDETVKQSGLSDDGLKLRLAIQLFVEEKLTLAGASKLAGLHQIEFQKELARRKIPIHYDVNDFIKDLHTISEINLNDNCK